MKKDLVLNLICLEVGIVPFGGGASGHIVKSLESLSPTERRKSSRKFRKILKKAIRHKALQSGVQKDSSSYNWRIESLRRLCGLDPNVKVFSLGDDLCSVFGNKITTEQSNFRSQLVREYLMSLYG